MQTAKGSAFSAAIRPRRAAPRPAPKSPSSGTSISDVERVGDDPQPLARARAAADGERPLDAGAGLGQRREAIGEGEGDALQHGAGERRSCRWRSRGPTKRRGWRRRCAVCARRRDRAGTSRRPARLSASSGPVSRRRWSPKISASHSSAPAADRMTPIWCQVSGTAWQKACTARRRVGREARVGDEQHARGAERDEGRARPDHADAAGRGGVVAAAAGHDDRGRSCPSVWRVRREACPVGAEPS